MKLQVSTDCKRAKNERDEVIVKRQNVNTALVTKTIAERYRGRLMPGLDLASVERPQPRQKAPVRAPKPKIAPLPTPAQAKRLATLDALWAEGLVTQAEYDAKKAEILG